MPLAHVTVAVEGCGWTHPDYFALMVTNMVRYYFFPHKSQNLIILLIYLFGLEKAQRNHKGSTA